MLSFEQIKGRLKNVAKENNADARILMRLYMMDRFLERLVESEYRDYFIIKGGILVTSMLGVSCRSTMDIDASLTNYTLSAENAEKIIKDICSIDLDDGISFEIKNAVNIMENREYTGIRVSVNALMKESVTPLKIDISTGDVITPGAVDYEYPLMLGEKTISIRSYNLETLLAEKLQAVLSRGTLNTRMRDFYDIYALSVKYYGCISADTLKKAFSATTQYRHTVFTADEADDITEKISCDDGLNSLWISYRKKYPYAEDIEYADAVEKIEELVKMIYSS